MTNKYFEIKSSITKKMKLSILSITFIIFCCFCFLFYSHYLQRKDLEILSNTFIVLSNNTQALEKLNALRENDLTSPDMEVNILLDQINANMSKLELSENDTRLIKISNDIKYIIADYKNNKLSPSELFTYLRTDLKKIQTFYLYENKTKFEEIVEKQYTPLLLSGLIAFILLTLSILWFWKISKEIRYSLLNILNATNKIKENYFDFSIPVVNQDELGLITFEINDMIEKLRKSRESLINSNLITNRLLNISGIFSKALTEDQVYEALFNYASLQIGKGVAAVYNLNEDKTKLKLIKSHGDPSGALIHFEFIDLSVDYPICQCVKSSQPIFLDDFIFIHPVSGETVIRKQVCLPLIVEGRSLGALSFNYPHSKIKNEGEEDFLMSLAGYCSEAIYRTKLYDSAKVAIALRDKFIAQASHELQTPLTPLKIQLQSLKRRILQYDSSSAVLSKNLKSIENGLSQIDKISKIIDELLHVTQININKIIINKKWINLNHFINTVLINFSKNEVATAPINIFNTTLHDTLVYWDTEKIEQVFLNLLSNAAKYAPNKSISIHVHEKDSYIYCKFRDYGPGIDMKNKEIIFQKFERIININNITGLGLGLYISRELVMAHHGTLELIETAGEGATFCLKLPLKD